jgi:hypothetical protein
LHLHFNRITRHVLGAAFHRTIVRHTSWLWSAHPFVHARWAAEISVITLVTFFHHHLVPATGLVTGTVMFHFADASCNAAEKKEESHGNKKPGDKGEEFTLRFLFEFYKQQGACKN